MSVTPGAAHGRITPLTGDTISSTKQFSGLRILFLVDELEGISAGGSERQVLQLIDLLRNAEHEVSLAVFRKSEWLKRENKAYSIHFCDLTSLISLKGILRMCQLVRWIRRERFDIVQTMFREANLIGPPLAKIAGVSVILGSRRNLNYSMTSTVALLQSISNRFATRLVANSEAVRQAVSRQERTSSAKIDVVYNGVDTRHFIRQLEARRATRFELQVPEDATLVGVISRFGRIKGQDIFVRAAAKVLGSHPDTYFVMVGDGPTREDIEKLVQQLDIRDRCLFVPAQRDIRRFLSSFDIAVLPSRSEGFSNSLLEYMSAGLPIVATDVGGNKESLRDYGILVPSEEPDALAGAINSLIESPEMRGYLGSGAQMRAQGLFDIDTAQARIAEYIDDLAKRYHLRSATSLFNDKRARATRS
jgi:glycosyltransferase involved in cell wall biosynthesis